MNNHYNCIYMYINKLNDKKYVGQAKNFNIRHRQHIKKSANKTPIDRAFNKYGEENFEIIILKENLYSQCLLNLYECYYIEKYNCLSKENYNISNGGHNGNNFAGKTEDEMEIIKHKMSESHKGENHPFYNKHLSEETKQKISESRKGKFIGKNNCMYGKQHTDEAKNKISEKAKERLKNKENNPMYNKHHTEESKNKMKENHYDCRGKNNPRARKVMQYDKNGKLIKIWNCIKDASDILHISRQSISNCCRERNKTAGGFIWEYYKGDE